MPDGGGFSGLDMSEIGAAAKAAGQGVKKVANPFLQAAKSQVTGKPAAPVGQQPAAPLKNAGLGFGDLISDIKSQTTGAQNLDKNQQGTPVSGTFDIAGHAKNLQQNQGIKAQQGFQPPSPTATSGSFNIPTSQPPSETNPKIKPAGGAGAFNANNLFDFNEKDSFAPKKPFSPQGAAPVQKREDMINNEEIEKQKMEDQKNIEILQRKLHEEQTKEVMNEGQTEGKENKEEEKKTKEQQEEEENEKKKQEKEERMSSVEAPSKKKRGFMGFKRVKSAMNLVTNMIKSRQGAKESKIGKG